MSGITRDVRQEIQRDSRIIAVCGVNDYENASSPSEDGWFHSDFYLFNRLFAGAGKYSLVCLQS